MAYAAEYQRPYENGYVNLPSEETPEMAEFINARDDAILKIEQFLANINIGELGGEYALLSEAGYSLGLEIDSNYVMTISLKNKAGEVLDSKNIDFPIESMVVNATYENGKVILTLQNGNTLPIDISDMIKGLVQTTRTIAGIDLTDDITAEELVSKEREVAGQIYVDFNNAEAAEGAVFPYMPYPKDASGNKLIGEAGQIYVANGDGTYSWLTIANAEEGAY